MVKTVELVIHLAEYKAIVFIDPSVTIGQNNQLHPKELFEFETQRSRFELLFVFREMNIMQSIPQRNEMITLQNGLRQGLWNTISDKSPGIADQIINRLSTEVSIVEFFCSAVHPLHPRDRSILRFEG